MRAAFYESTGPARDVLRIGEMPDPTPGPDEVRVRLRWSGVNPTDVKTRAGLRTKVLPFARIVPHHDGMGVIDALGPGVPASRSNERVWLWNGAWQRPCGTAAQYIVVPQDQAVPLPDNVPDEAGACLGIPALTALHAVLRDGGVEGRTVLVAGGAGAVGHYAIQFARRLGAAHVLATVSNAAKAALATSAGAHTVIDYRRDSVVERVREATRGRGVDRIIEVDIAANGPLDVDIVTPGGDCVVYGSGDAQFTLPFFATILKNLTLRFFIVFSLAPEDRNRSITTLTRLLRHEAIEHNIAERVPLDEIARAHELLEAGRNVGNVVVAVP